jgi:DNA-binding NtrC family response regulator
MSEIMTCAQRMQLLLRRAQRFAATRGTILITGESGTGKGLLAQYVHTNSAFSHGPWVAVNCAALSESVIESELFGHEPGAFTGAVTQRKGRFELAAGGTLLLDEFGELSPAMQAKLLRVLEEGDFQRVGGMTTLKLNARILVATNRDLAAEVASGRFREDLWYRVNPLELQMPPLRDRLEDLPLLVKHFLKQFQREGCGVTEVAPDVSRQLRNYDWPGNVRELRNVLLRACALASGGCLESLELPKPATLPMHSIAVDQWHGQTLAQIERQVILDRLERYGGHQGRVAATLGITSRTLRNKMAEYRELGATG